MTRQHNEKHEMLKQFEKFIADELHYASEYKGDYKIISMFKTECNGVAHFLYHARYITSHELGQLEQIIDHNFDNLKKGE